MFSNQFDILTLQETWMTTSLKTLFCVKLHKYAAVKLIVNTEPRLDYNQNSLMDSMGRLLQLFFT